MATTQARARTRAIAPARAGERVTTPGKATTRAFAAARASLDKDGHDSHKQVCTIEVIT